MATAANLDPGTIYWYGNSLSLTIPGVSELPAPITDLFVPTETQPAHREILPGRGTLELWVSRELLKS